MGAPKSFGWYEDAGGGVALWRLFDALGLSLAVLENDAGLSLDPEAVDVVYPVGAAALAAADGSAQMLCRMLPSAMNGWAGVALSGA